MKKGRMAPGSCSEPCGHVMLCNPNLCNRYENYGNYC